MFGLYIHIKYIDILNNHIQIHFEPLSLIPIVMREIFHIFLKDLDAESGYNVNLISKSLFNQYNYDSVSCPNYI